MTLDLRTSPKTLSDQELLSRLDALAHHERSATVELIVHLIELDARKLYRAEGFGSLFRYCTDALRLSEHAAYGRIEAARIAQTFPVVLDRLADGSVNLTGLCLLGPHLKPENHIALLAEAAGRSKRDVEMLVARLAPQPDVPTSVRKLPGQQAEPLERGLQTVNASDLDDRPGLREQVPDLPGSSRSVETPRQVGPIAEGQAGSVALAGRGMTSPHHARPVVSPVAPERYRVQFTIGRETFENLRLVQDLLRREIPDGDPATIFDRALTLLLADTARKKVGAMSSRRRRGPRREAGVGSPASSASRDIPPAVKHEVWIRDRGQCAFVAKNGRRCAERAYLEFHHVQPYALDGETTARNISLRCRSHNVYEAELVFGTAAMARHSSTARGTRSGPSCQPDGRHRRLPCATRPGLAAGTTEQT